MSALAEFLHLLNSDELPASFSGETVHFRCKWTPPWTFPRRALRRDVLSHANPTSPPSSSPTLASSSVAVVHLWPKVSTPSRSSRRFLSVLLFSCTFRGRFHLIPFTLPFSVYTVSSRSPLVHGSCSPGACCQGCPSLTRVSLAYALLLSVPFRASAWR
jgi:hypothetical protein